MLAELAVDLTQAEHGRGRERALGVHLRHHGLVRAPGAAGKSRRPSSATSAS